MHELGFFLVGLFVGSCATVGLLSLLRSAADADRWGEELRKWDGSGTLYDWQHETEPANLKIRRSDEPTYGDLYNLYDPFGGAE